jgi:predicted PurR-regulated permease PerM
MVQSNVTTQTVIKVLFVIAAVWALLNAKTVLFPIILSIVLAFILHPLVEFFIRCRCYPLKATVPRGVAVLLAFAVAFTVLVLLVAFVLIPFAHEFERFAGNLPDYMGQVQNLVFQLQQSASEVELPGSVRVLMDEGMSNAAGYSVELGRRFLAGTIGIASRVIDLVVVPVLTFYFLKDWLSIRDTFINLVPAAQRPKVRQIIVEIGTVISGYIRGQVTVSTIIGLLVFIGMYIFDLNFALTIGLIAALTEFVPIIGPIIGAIPALLIALLTSPLLAVKVVIFYIFIHQLENHIIVPKVMGHSIDLHPVTVILAFLIGAQLFGLAGMILAVPVAAILKVIFYHVWKV